MFSIMSDTARTMIGRHLPDPSRLIFRKGAAVARDARRSTLVDIAADAGVSVSAVSKVLNGRADVAAGTRARIAGLLRQHGYQVASRLGFGVVDLLIADLHSPWAEELLRGTMEAANEAGTSVIATTVHSPQEFAGWLDRATARGTDGALCVLHLPGSRELHRLAAARIPLVAIDPPVEPGDAIRSVGTTNWLGGMTATRHLIELGHRRIAIIGGPPGLWSSRARLDHRPGWTAIARPCRPPGSAWTKAWSAGATSRCPAGGRRPGSSSRCRSRPRPSWPATTARRSACSRP
jgi:transcriptional regulator with XRE-family HTH domain